MTLGPWGTFVPLAGRRTCAESAHIIFFCRKQLFLSYIQLLWYCADVELCPQSSVGERGGGPVPGSVRSMACKYWKVFFKLLLLPIPLLPPRQKINGRDKRPGRMGIRQRCLSSSLISFKQCGLNPCFFLFESLLICWCARQRPARHTYCILYQGGGAEGYLFARFWSDVRLGLCLHLTSHIPSKWFWSNARCAQCWYLKLDKQRLF